MNHERPLSFLEEQFLLEYLGCNNYAEAARRCGMEYQAALNLSERNAFKRELLRLQTTTMGRAEVTAQRIIDELATIAFLNPKELLNSDGNLKDIHALPDDVARAVVGLKVTCKDGERYMTTTTEPKLGDKLRALEMLGKTAGIKLFADVIETKDTTERPGASTVDIEERIQQMGTSRDPSLIEPD